MNGNTKRLFAVMATFALIAMGAGAVAAAPGSVDSTPPADDTTTVYITDGGNATEFNASENVDYALPLLNVTATDADELAMNVTTEDDDEVYSFSGTWDSYASGEADTSTDYIHNISGDELNDVPMNIDENVSITVMYWNTTVDEPDPTNVTFYLENTDERSVHRVDEDAATTDVDNVSQPFYRRADFGWLGTNEYSVVDVEDESVEVNGSATDVVYVLGDEETQDPFADETEEISDGGEFLLMTADVDADSSGPVPMFYQEAPDWYEADDMGTYSVYDPDENMVTYHTEDDEFEDETEGDFTFSSDVYRVTDIRTVWNLAGGYSGAGVDAIVSMTMG